MTPLLAHDRYCDEIAHQVGLLRSVVTSGADLSGTVPTCPDWSLEDLVRHMGGALRWVELSAYPGRGGGAGGAGAGCGRARGAG